MSVLVCRRLLFLLLLFASLLACMSDNVGTAVGGFQEGRRRHRAFQEPFQIRNCFLKKKRKEAAREIQLSVFLAVYMHTICGKGCSAQPKTDML